MSAAKLYFEDDSGTIYRVYDVTYSEYKHHERGLADPAATSRLFVAKDGKRRVYQFKPKESRVLELQALERSRENRIQFVC